MKFGVCAIIKNENLYLREWVEHYINLGFDKIILYDNNDQDGEIPNIVIQDYIDAGIVDIYKTKTSNFTFGIQTSYYNECLTKYKNELDWIAFFDIDEFLELYVHKKIQYLFDDKINDYNKYDTILVSWYTILDSGQMYYENKPVQARFTQHCSFQQFGKYAEMDCFVKSFVKTSGDGKFNGQNMHVAYSNKMCNAYGNLIYDANENTMGIENPVHEDMYLKHYYTKSLTEFLYKKRINAKLEDIFNAGSPYYNKQNWSEEHEKTYQEFLKYNKIKASN